MINEHDLFGQDVYDDGLSNNILVFNEEIAIRISTTTTSTFILPTV